MPNYRCLIPKDALNYDQRARIATAFTDVHCGISAAPRNFVHVQFIEQDGNSKLSDTHGNSEFTFDTKYYIAGGNRAGRPPKVKDQILDGLIDEFCQISGVSRNDVSGHISEGPASWVMEGGHILPEPGEEPPEWYQNDV